MHLTPDEQAILNGADSPAATLAMRIVVEMAELAEADRLVEISSAHIDGCLYHGDSGVEFAERLVEGGGRVRVPTTLNVGALDLVNPNRVRSDPHRRAMAGRLMSAYRALGCRPTWTCAPYQVGHRPQPGEHVAWGESNAVAFANSVLGARTNRYGDFMDICCALIGRAPLTGLHRSEARRATVIVDTRLLSSELKQTDAFYPVLGSWLGTAIGNEVAALDGLPSSVSDDNLKALGAAAASTGAIGLFHVVGVTPEARDLDQALGGLPPRHVLTIDPAEIRAARDRLSTTQNDQVDVIALGSPHFSLQEFVQLERLAGGRTFSLPVYVCTARDTLNELGPRRTERLSAMGVEIVADTCVVVTPILPTEGRVLMTNSGKFAHYTPANTGYDVVYGSLEDCVATAHAGRLVRDERIWM